MSRILKLKIVSPKMGSYRWNTFINKQNSVVFIFIFIFFYGYCRESIINLNWRNEINALLILLYYIYRHCVRRTVKKIHWIANVKRGEKGPNADEGISIEPKLIICPPRPQCPIMDRIENLVERKLLSRQTEKKKKCLYVSWRCK